MENDQEYDGTLESLEERFQKHARQGGVGESGGCTDASVRLSNLLKVTVTWISAWTQMKEFNVPIILECFDKVLDVVGQLWGCSAALSACSPGITNSAHNDGLILPQEATCSVQDGVSRCAAQIQYANLCVRWQALVHAPVGVVKDKGQEWVPLCLSYLSAQQPGYQPDSIDATAETNALKAGIELGTAAEAAEDAEESGTAAKIGARCVPHENHATLTPMF